MNTGALPMCPQRHMDAQGTQFVWEYLCNLAKYPNHTHLRHLYCPEPGCISLIFCTMVPDHKFWWAVDGNWSHPEMQVYPFVFLSVQEIVDSA